MKNLSQAKIHVGIYGKDNNGSIAGEQHELKRKGTVIFTGNENECYFKLQRVQSQSADWAMRYESYTITPVNPAPEPIKLYKVVKIFRVSGRRQILEKNLTESQAQRLVQSFPDSNRSMVVYFSQS